MTDPTPTPAPLVPVLTEAQLLAMFPQFAPELPVWYPVIANMTAQAIANFKAACLLNDAVAAVTVIVASAGPNDMLAQMNLTLTTLAALDAANAASMKLVQAAVEATAVMLMEMIAAVFGF